MLNNECFWTNLEPEKGNIIDLYRNRKNMIHLKTSADDDLMAYFNVIDEMLDLYIFSCIDATTNFINSAEKKY
jgi:hypothetical protein